MTVMSMLLSGSTPPLVASVPVFVSAVNAASPVDTGSVHCTATGGVPPYTSFSWTKDSGDSITILSPAVQDTVFRGMGMFFGENRNADFYCTVTDSLGHFAISNICSVSVTRS